MCLSTLLSVSDCIFKPPNREAAGWRIGGNGHLLTSEVAPRLLEDGERDF